MNLGKWLQMRVYSYSPDTSNLPKYKIDRSVQQKDPKVAFVSTCQDKEYHYADHFFHLWSRCYCNCSQIYLILRHSLTSKKLRVPSMKEEFVNQRVKEQMSLCVICVFALTSLRQEPITEIQIQDSTNDTRMKELFPRMKGRCFMNTITSNLMRVLLNIRFT